MQIEKSSGVGGSWIDKKSLKNGDIIKIKSEATWIEGTNGKQLVAKMRVKGQSEDVNVTINTPTKNAFVDAFGSDSALWIDKVLTVAVEPGIFAGKRGIMLNLVPEGYVIGEDATGYITIHPKIKAPDVVTRSRNAQEVEEDIDIDSVPF